MIRKNMDLYLLGRLLFFKKGYEDIKDFDALYENLGRDRKVKITHNKKEGSFEFRLYYELTPANIGKLGIKISALDEKARSKLERKFKKEFFPKGVKKDNLVIRDFRFGRNSYVFYTDLVSIHDKHTYESVFEHFVKPLVF